MLSQHYNHHQRLGQKVPEFLKGHGFTDWQTTAYTGDYFPKFMARAGS